MDTASLRSSTGKGARILKSDKTRGAPSKTASTVLVVDDQLLVARALADRLACEGLEAVVAGTAAEALAAVEGRDCRLAFVDLKLPDMSGTALATQLKRKSPRVQVVLMTGFATEVDDPEMCGAHCDTVLPKPWTPGELDAVLRAFRERKR